MEGQSIEGKSKEISNFHIESFFLRLPIVYTPKLEEMTVFRRDLSKKSNKDIIELIISESKPLYRGNGIGSISNAIKCKTKHDSNKRAKDYLHKARDWQILNSKFEQLQSKLDDIKMKWNTSNIKPEVVVKSEIGKDNGSRSNLETLLALCKPLKIVLKDIKKMLPAPKLRVEVKIKEFNNSADADDIFTIGEEKTIATPDADIKSAISLEENRKPAVNYTIRDVDNLKSLLLTRELCGCCIIIYNLYLNELEAYRIGNYHVTEYKTLKYTEVNRFSIKRCKAVINMVSCCWKRRQSYVSLLEKSTKYLDIAKSISSTHPCKENCTCCCNTLEQSKSRDANEATSSDVMAEECVMNSSQTITKGQSKLITTALVFENKKKSKWYPEETYNLNNKNKVNNLLFKRMLKFDSIEGGVEFYEIGSDELIYSKITSSNVDASSWLFKTLHQPRNRANFTFTDPEHRERKIAILKQMNNYFPFHSECFLKNQHIKESKKKPRTSSDYSQFKKYKIQHTRSISQKSQVVSIVSELRKKKYHVPCIRRVIPVKPSSDCMQSQSKTKRTQRTQPQAPVIDEKVSQIINSLIKDILHRFRDVLLTINSEGRVAAALNAPLTSLTAPELNILSQILGHAQSQVDKLGLTPGTCLNPDTPLAIQSTSDKPTTSTIDTSEICDGITKTINKKNTNIGPVDFLVNSSSIIDTKKTMYKQSFCNYLGDPLTTAPKITNVFSLKRANETPLDILEHPLEGSTAVVEVGNNSCSATVTNEDEDTGTITDIRAKESSRPRKRKQCFKCNTEVPKIRIKSKEEVLVKNSAPVIASVASPNLGIAGCPSKKATVIFTPVLLPNPNYGSGTNVLNNYIAVPKKCGILSVPQKVPQINAKFTNLRTVAAIIIPSPNANNVNSK